MVRPARRGSLTLTLIAMCFAQGMILLDITIVNVALPSIQHELDVSTGDLEWVVSAYALALATCIPLGGAIGDRYGRKRFFMAGMVVFTLASAGCALSTTSPELITFRVVQGLGGAMMAALTLSILVEAFPKERQAGVVGTWAAVAGLGFGLGPVVGGILLGFADWSSVFWVNVPLGVLAVVIAGIGVAESKDPVPRPLDVTGVVLSAIGLFALTLGLIQSQALGWGSSEVLALVTGGLAMLAAFVWWEHHCPTPMLPPSLVHNARFMTTNVVYFLAYLALTGMFFYVTLLYQDVQGWSALRTGLSWIVMNAPFLVMAQAAGWIAARVPRRKVIVAGCVVGGLGIVGLGQVHVGTPFALAGVSYFLLGLGYGTFIPAASSLAMSRVPAGVSGIASGMLNTSRQVGSSVGLAVLGALGVTLTTRYWHTSSAHLAGASAAAAARSTADVTGGQVAAVRAQLGPAAARVATASFVHGYQVALTCAGIAVVLAAVIAWFGLRGTSGEEEL